MGENLLSDLDQLMKEKICPVHPVTIVEKFSVNAGDYSI
jgi:hypothetical protein